MNKEILYVECPVNEGMWLKLAYCYESKRKKKESCVGCTAPETPVRMMEILDICRKREDEKRGEDHEIK